MQNNNDEIQIEEFLKKRGKGLKIIKRIEQKREGKRKKHKENRSAVQKNKAIIYVMFIQY